MNPQISAVVQVPTLFPFNVFGYTVLERSVIALQKSGVKTIYIMANEPEKCRSLLSKWNSNQHIQFFHLTDFPLVKNGLSEQKSNAVFHFQQPLVVDISVLEEMMKMSAPHPQVSVAGGELELMQLADFLSFETSGRIGTSPTFIDLGTRSCHPIQIKSDLQSVKKRLLKNLTKPADGWVSRNINRRFSKRVSSLLAYTPVTPTIFTALNGLVAFAPIYFMYQGGYRNWLIGAALYQLASILDGVDGELARLKMQHSRFGQWLDTFIDFTSGVALLLALALGVQRADPISVLPVAGYLAVMAGILSIISLSFYVVRTGFGGNFRIPYQFYESDSCWSRFLLSVKFLGQRDFYIFFFLLLAIAGLLPFALVYFAVMAALIFILSLQSHFLVKTA